MLSTLLQQKEKESPILPGSSHGRDLQTSLLSMDHGSCLTYSSLLHTHSRAPRCSCPEYLTSSMCDAILPSELKKGLVCSSGEPESRSCCAP
jgi:hypothetical protein